MLLLKQPVEGLGGTLLCQSFSHILLFLVMAAQNGVRPWSFAFGRVTLGWIAALPPCIIVGMPFPSMLDIMRLAAMQYGSVNKP